MELKETINMKQSITKEQWDELSDKEKIKIMSFFDKSFLGDEENLTEGFYIPYKIGRLIEFLGDDLDGIDYKKELTQKWYRVSIGERLIDDHDELIDALWMATKYKLNENK